MHFFVNNIFFLCEIAAKENVKTASYGSVIIIGVGVTAGENFLSIKGFFPNSMEK